MKLSDDDRAALQSAKNLLENPGLTAKITNMIGVPIEKAFELLPAKWAERVNGATRKSLDKALHVALRTLGAKPQTRSRNILHKIAVAITGSGGGFFGLPGQQEGRCDKPQ